MPDEPTNVISPDDPTAAQAAELDFEGQVAQTAADEAAQAAQDAEDRLARVEEELAHTQQALESANRPPEQAGWTREDLEDLADEDPLAAADVLARMRVEQLAQQVGQQLAPVLQSHNQAEATRTVDALRAEFGPAFEANKKRLVEIVSRDEAFYLDPATRPQRLRQALQALEFERLASGAGDPDAVTYDSMDSSGQLVTDSFGKQPRSRETGRFESPQARRTAYVEGGSGPQPPVQQPNVDPVIAEMDGLTVGHDVFGTLGIGGRGRLRG